MRAASSNEPSSAADARGVSTSCAKVRGAIVLRYWKRCSSTPNGLKTLSAAMRGSPAIPKNAIGSGASRCCESRSVQVMSNDARTSLAIVRVACANTLLRSEGVRRYDSATKL